ncbi:TPA: hypothetical protein ACT2IF_000424 [Streptococcus suis]|nr:hypothetical protein [Streptococcus suis]HEL2396867.1 hypothetical protein [Streptococcus suis]HEL9618570.1 hypothetical protein [Streptococcus suis]HEL9649772.1 hypothetical protein [Streptococcus suis]
MALKNLNHFTAFNAPLFLSRKELRFVSSVRWVEKTDSGTEVEKGTKVGLLIFEDKSDYPNPKTNVGEQLVVKVPHVSPDHYENFQPMQTICDVVDVQKAVVYGEYRNQLSITANVVASDDQVIEL